MKTENLKVWNYYYYEGFEMEYIWFFWYNYIFRVKFIYDKLLQEIWSVERVFESRKDMIFYMYWYTIEKEIKKLEELKRDRKEYKDLIVQELQKFSKNLSDNAIITSVLQNENVAISLAIAKKIKEYIDALSEKYIKNEI